MDLKQQFNRYLLSALLLLFFISEAYGKITIIYFQDKSEIAKYIKLVVLIFFAVALIQEKKDLFKITLLCCFIGIGQFFLKDGFSLDILTSYVKLLFPLLLFFYFNHHKNDVKTRALGFKMFEIVLLINCCLILIGFVFDINLFSTYRGSRFGFNGLLITSATGSYFYAIALFYLLVKYKRQFFKKPLVLLAVACAFLLGTKVGYIAILAVVISFLIHFISIKKKKAALLILAIASVSALAGYVFFFKFGLFNKIRVEDGLISSILSYRDDLLVETTLPYIQEYWGPIHYIFGGITALHIRSQLGFVDVFLYWGILDHSKRNDR